VAHEPVPSVLILLRRVVPSVYSQLQEFLLSAWQRGRPPRNAAAPRGVIAVLHPAVLPGSKHHPRISNAFVVAAFQQGVRDKKMLEKLATHDV
jgi:hypothetical protein